MVAVAVVVAAVDMLKSEPMEMGEKLLDSSLKETRLGGVFAAEIVSSLERVFGDRSNWKCSLLEILDAAVVSSEVLRFLSLLVDTFSFL